MRPLIRTKDIYSIDNNYLHVNVNGNIISSFGDLRSGNSSNRGFLQIYGNLS